MRMRSKHVPPTGSVHSFINCINVLAMNAHLINFVDMQPPIPPNCGKGGDWYTAWDTPLVLTFNGPLVKGGRAPVTNDGGTH